MPIDPTTGIYQESQGSPFPGGTFGGALQINNNQIAQSIANENAAKRQLALHLAELESQKAQLEIDDEIKKQGWADDEHTREALFRDWQSKNTGADTPALLRKASELGVPDAQQRNLGNIVIAETNKAAKDATLNKDWSEEARKEATSLFAMGMKGKDVADLLEPKYVPKGVPQLYFDKMRMVGVSPLTNSVIKKNEGAATASKARADKDNNAPAKPAVNVEKLKAKRLNILAQQANVASKIATAVNNDADEASIAVLRGVQMDLASELKKLDLDIAAAEPPPQTLTPTNPSPSTTDVKPPRRFAPFPAKQGTKENDPVTVELKDGTKLPGVVRNGMVVPVN